MIVVPNEGKELILMQPITRWSVFMDYPKLNARTEKDNFPMPFMDKILDKLVCKSLYCFIDGYFRL